jgi:hypothetical protein
VEAKYGLNAKPCVMKAHPTRQGILAVGMSCGEVVFVNYSNLHTFSVALSAKAKRASNEESKAGEDAGQNEELEEVSV